MLIFEGPDGSGKSTLIKMFQDIYNVPKAPRVVTKDAEAMVDLQRWVEDNLREGFQYRIFDRHRLISEPIYGPILRQKQEEGFNNFLWLSQQIEDFYRIRPIIIYCLPPFETVQQNILNHDDNKVVQSQIEAIYTAYAARISIDFALTNRIYFWDYTKHDPGALPYWFENIHHILEMHAQ